MAGNAPVAFNPYEFELFAGLEVPDPITFILGKSWLAQTTVYPRQGTFLKIVFLRDDLFTDYDHKVIDEWEHNFMNGSLPHHAPGQNGIAPGIRDRIKILKQDERKWFRELILVMGRRAGKGHISAQAMSYVLWNYMSLGNPQEYFGIAPNKVLECLIYAGKKAQARANLFKDLADAIINGPCFAPYISRSQTESLTIYAPFDKVKMAQRQKRGISIGGDQASFRLEPKEATLMSGRGGASFMQGYDEMAHVVASGANRSAEEIYSAAKPSLDQFKKWAFITEPSSPWQMIGQFYTNYEQSLAEKPDGTPLDPTKLMIQLASWDIYKDWEIAHTIDAFPADFEGDLGEYVDEPPPKFPPLKLAFQEYDEQMEIEEGANKDTFAVERLSHWATTMDAYLDPAKIEEMWNPELDNRIKRGPLDFYYKGHGDPSNSNANFGLAVAHLEENPDGTPWRVCVFDYIHHWAPADFPDQTIDYPVIIDEIWEIIKTFPIDEFTVDQFNSGPVISSLKGKLHKEQHFLTWKRPTIFEVTATAQLNWKKAENFKVAINQGWVKAPYYEQADLELKFLKLTETSTTMRVEKQEAGPVTTKDVADTMFECVYALLGDQIMAYMEGLSASPSASLQGGVTPFSNITNADDARFSTWFGRGGAAPYSGDNGFGGSASPTRGLRRPGYRPNAGR